jgi:ligand-binding sensor domain-containing protein/DNA-binding CsgD family transcriptional regulator
MMKRFLLICFHFCLLSSLSGQNTIGLPDIINYTKQTYNAGAQNRQIRQDRNGILYFANNDGVLTFDGKNWKTYPLPNKSIVRSIEFGPDNRLYVGGQDEFGYFSPNKQGQLEYHSLKNLVPKAENSFTDVWKIEFYQGRVFFQTSNKIFQLSGQHCTVYNSVHWRFLGNCNNQLIAQDPARGLLTFQNDVWVPFILPDAVPKDFFISASTAIGKDSTLLTTRKHGIYLLTANTLTPLRSSFLDQIAHHHISGVKPVNKEHIALVTNLNGCYIIDKQGNLIQSFSTKEGLQNNNILEVFLDREKNIWLGLDNGIDFIAYNNAVKLIFPAYQNEGSGYASIIHNNQLYIGTSNGLYTVPLYNHPDLSFVKGHFKQVTNTNGQVWNLSIVNDELLLGHHDGSFVIRNNAATAIDNTTGFWNFFPLSNVLPSSILLMGTYQGINFFDYKNKQFLNKNVHAHFESARFIVIDNNAIWASHPYKGVYKVTYTEGQKPIIKKYTDKENVTSVNDNYIFKVRNQIVLTTANGIYEYNAVKDRFEMSAFYNNLFGSMAIRYLKEDREGNIWFVFNKSLGVVDLSTGKPQLIYLPELNNKLVDGFEHIYPVNRNNVFVGREKGFYHINYEQYKKNNYPLQVQIRMVRATGNSDSLFFGGYSKEVNEINEPGKNKLLKIDHSWNSIHLEFASAAFAQRTSIEYSYYLEGFDPKWSSFSQKTEKEYTNLSAGTYTFHVKARNNLGNESGVTSFTFIILPPWYQTYWAYCFYTLIFFGVMYLLYLRQKRKFKAQRTLYEEEQKRVLYLHQLELEKNEKEIIKLRNEKLEIELAHKNNELASSAMHLLQKGELLTNLKEELKRLTKTSSDEKTIEQYKKIIKILGEDDRVEKDWEHFAQHFDNVHSDFLVALKAKHPTLTPNELKLCAHLRMNLTTKDIAQLMNISVRGVEISRYRLRKKLQIPTEMNLFDYLMSIHAGGNALTTKERESVS